MEKIKIIGIGEIKEVKGLMWSKVRVLNGEYKGKYGWFYDGGYSSLDEDEELKLDYKSFKLKVEFEEPNWDELEDEIK